MPSFPTSVFSPSAKTSGQVIQASHVNDLQDEIVAVEGALINGPLTLATVQVSGGSTFATRPVMPPPDVARVELAANTSFPTSTQAISWTSQIILTNSSVHSTTTNPMRLTPQSTGVYRFDANINVSTGANTRNIISIEDSSGGIIASLDQTHSAGTQGFFVSGLKRFDSVAGSTQWARVVLQMVASTGSVLAVGTHFSMTKL